MMTNGDPAVQINFGMTRLAKMMTNGDSVVQINFGMTRLAK